MNQLIFFFLPYHTALFQTERFVTWCNYLTIAITRKLAYSYWEYLYDVCICKEKKNK